MKFFGPQHLSNDGARQQWGADDDPRVEVPVGAKCIDCEEEIAANDRGVLMSALGLGPGDKADSQSFDLQATEVPMHRECFVAQIQGSAEHQQRRCHCFGGHDEPDEKLTRRQVALRAVEYFEISHGIVGPGLVATQPMAHA